MTDIKRKFLYEFNRGLRDAYSNKPTVVSVFENIDSGNIKLSPTDIPNADFVKEVGKCISAIKKIVANPYKVVGGNYEVVPVSNAKSIDKEAIKLTLDDPTLWTIEKGKHMPKLAYSFAKEDVFVNYENAFIYQLINVTILRLKSVLSSLESTKHSEASEAEFAEFSETVKSYIRKLSRLSNEKVFEDNSRRSVDLSNVFVTDTIKSDKRYNFCYKFFCENIRSHKKISESVTDFRVLYHNFALVQIMYYLNKSGYKIEDSEYYVSVTDKVFIKPIVFNGSKKITLIQTANGVDIEVDGKLTHIEFAKSLLKSAVAISDDCEARVKKLACDKYEKVYVAYLSSIKNTDECVLNIGYQDVEKTINRLIQSL